jgi:hypothetical protein
MKEREAEGRLMQAFHGVFALASATIGGSIVTLLVFGLVFRGKAGAIWQAESQWTRILGRMIAICLLGVLLVVLGVAATHVREKWLVLFLVLLPLYLCLKVEAAKFDPVPGFRRFVPLIACIVLGALVVVSARAVVRPWFGDYSKLNIPYAAFVEEVVKTEGRPPALVLTNDRQIAGNIRTRLADATVVIPHLAGMQAADAAKRPLLVVWRDEANPAPLPATLNEALKASGVAESEMNPRKLELPYIYASGADRYGFSYIWVGE